MNKEREQNISILVNELKHLDEKEESIYQVPVTFVTLHFIYINKQHEIKTILQQQHLLQSPNILKQHELLSLLKQYRLFHDKQHTLISLFQFNLSLLPQEFDSFLTMKLNHSSNTSNPFGHSITRIMDIPFCSTLSMFQDMNDLFVLFYEKEKEKEKEKDQQQYHQRQHNENEIRTTELTKKIYVSSFEHKNKRQLTKKNHK